MRPVLVAVVIVAALLTCHAAAQSTVSFSAQPFVQTTSGESSYLFDYDLSALAGEPYRIQSKLVFPQDLVMAGFQAQIAKFDTMAARRRSLTVRFAKGMTDPSGTMTDSDWFNNLLFSYTESSAEAHATMLAVEGTELLWQTSRFELSLYAAYRYMDYANSITGFSGWYLPYDTNTNQYVSTPEQFGGTELALLYDITYHIPHLGLSSRVRFGSRLSGEGVAAFLFPYMKDRDIHLLRSFSTEADGFGSGFLGRLGGRWQMSQQLSGGPFIELGLEYLTMSADVTSTQRYYTDSPDSPDDETGATASALPHELSTDQLNIRFALGLQW